MSPDVHTEDDAIISDSGRELISRASSFQSAERQACERWTFVAFKQWTAGQAQNREPVKRRRDLYPAKIVQELMDKGLRVSRASVGLPGLSAS